MNKYRHQNSPGFTLVEVLLSTLLMGILAITLGLFLNESVSLYTLIPQRQNDVYKASYAAERILEKIMTSRNPPSELLVTLPTALTFIQADGTSVSYFLQSDGTQTALMEQVNGQAAMKVANTVSAFRFTYYTAGGPLSGTRTTTPSLVA